MPEGRAEPGGVSWTSRWMQGRLALASLALSLAACGGAAEPTPAPSPAATPAPTPTPLPQGVAHLVAHLEEPQAPAGDLIGWNLGAGTYYALPEDPLHPEWRTPEREAAIAYLNALQPAEGGPPLIRFSGLQIDGMLGEDGYHFFDYVDPTHTPAPDDNMASFQYMALIEEAGGEAVVMLNFGSGRAQEGADYVCHLVGTGADDPYVAARHHWGFEEPFPVDRFEIGNEVYGFWNTGYISNGDYSYANPQALHGGDPDWYGKPSSVAENYGARALAYLEAALQEAPGATFFIPLTHSTMDSWGGIEVASQALLPLLEHPAVAGVVVHQYKVDDVLAEGHLDVNSPEMILAGSEWYRAGFEALRVTLDALPTEAPLPIAVTEYHVAGAFAGPSFAQTDTPLLGLGIADLLIFYAQLDVAYALQHTAIGFPEPDSDEPALFEPWYNPFRATGDGGVRPMPTYTVTRLFAEHLLAQRAPLEVDAIPTREYLVGESPMTYPLIHGVAFVDGGGGSGTILLLNRDLEGPVDVTVDLPPGWALSAAKVYAPGALDLDATEVEIEVEALPAVQVRGRVRLELPPHSLGALSLGVEGG